MALSAPLVVGLSRTVHCLTFGVVSSRGEIYGRDSCFGFAQSV